VAIPKIITTYANGYMMVIYRSLEIVSTGIYYLPFLAYLISKEADTKNEAIEIGS
jgi:hypothetical protein